MIREKVEQVVFVDDGIEAAQRLSEGFIKIAHEQNVDPLRMMWGKECIKIQDESFARIWIQVS